jgi:hypothetical protein
LPATFARDPRLILGAFTLIGAFASSACLETDFALDSNPEVPGDRNVLGAWQCTPAGAPAETVESMVVTLTESRVYEIARVDASGGSHAYRAYGSRLMPRLLNVADITDPEQPWRYVRFTLEPAQRLRLSVVSAAAFRGVPLMRTFVRLAIERQRNSPDLFEDLVSCTR